MWCWCFAIGETLDCYFLCLVSLLPKFCFDKSVFSARISVLLNLNLIMARGKSTFCTWFCGKCNKGNYISTYNKRGQEEAMKAKNKYCDSCRGHCEHKRKDTKS